MKKNVILRWSLGKTGLLVGMALFGLCWSCGDDDEEKPTPFDPSKPVTIESFIPDSGGVGTQLVILGQNFGEDTAQVKVTVNDKKATVIGVTSTRIYAVVPARAGTGTVTVTMDGSASVTSEKTFKYKIRQNVSTVTGRTDDSGHGSIVDGTLDVAAFLYPYYLAIDDENNMFVVQRLGVATTSTGSVTRAIRLVALNENQVTTRLSAGGEFTHIRAIDFSLSQDTLWCINDIGATGGVGIFTMTRDQGWYNPTPQLRQTTDNGVVVNPVDGLVIYSYYRKSFIRYFNPVTGEVKDLMTMGENYVVYLCFSRDGKYLYLSIPEGYQAYRGKVYRAVWHPDTKTLTDVEQIVPIDYLSYPEQIVCDADGNLYICDSGNHTIEMWDPKTRTVSTFAGVRGESGYLDDVPLKSKFNSPTGICVAKDGTIYVADNGNHRIRKIVVE